MRWGGAVAPPHLSFTPLSSQENISFNYSGSGWRGARGEVKNTFLIQTEPELHCILGTKQLIKLT